MRSSNAAVQEAARKAHLRSLGLCMNCKEPTPFPVCDGCHDVNRRRTRERYREKNNIPLDAPLLRAGRRRTRR